MYIHTHKFYLSTLASTTIRKVFSIKVLTAGKNWEKMYTKVRTTRFIRKRDGKTRSTYNFNSNTNLMD